VKSNPPLFKAATSQNFGKAPFQLIGHTCPTGSDKAKIDFAKALIRRWGMTFLI
jgi:hypothetical protein